MPAENVRFDEDRMRVALSDGRSMGVPLAWFPRLMRAGAAERAAYAVSAFGIHWDGIDEAVLVAGLLAGRGDRTAARLLVRGLLCGLRPWP